MVSTQIFTLDEQAKIRQGIESAELKTQGEIVVAISRRSAGYSATNLILSIFLSYLVYVLAAYLYYEETLLFLGLLQGTSLLLAFALFENTPVPVWLSQSSIRSRNVRHAAKEIFLDNSLHTTKERAAVLIYLSLEERQMEILVDVGLKECVLSNFWEDLAKVVASMAKVSMFEAVLLGIRECSATLEKKLPRK